MSTDAQIAAKRENAQLSTGPKTEAGKEASSINNFRHGFTGRFLVMPWENLDQYESLITELQAEHRPTTPTEEILVGKMAQHHWLAQRAIKLQDQTFSFEMPKCEQDKQLALYIRYQTTQDRAFHKCLADLLKLRAEKRKEQIGFESQKHKEQAEERKQEVEKRKQDKHEWDILLASAKVDHQRALTYLATAPRVERELEREFAESESKAA